MDREEAIRRVAGYDADRYTSEMPDRLLRALAEAPFNQKLCDLEGKRMAKQENRENEVEPRQRGPLSEAEWIALNFASHGLKEREIGDVLYKERYTIQTQLKSARQKLRAKNTTHAVAIAMRMGFLT